MSLLRRRAMERLAICCLMSRAGGAARFFGLRGTPALADPRFGGRRPPFPPPRAFRSCVFFVHFADPAGPVVVPRWRPAVWPRPGAGPLPQSFQRGVDGGSLSGEQQLSPCPGRESGRSGSGLRFLARRPGQEPPANNTTVALWSPLASPLTEVEAAATRDLRRPALQCAVCLSVSGRGPRGVAGETAVRAVDVPAALVAAGGGRVPDEWDGVSLLRGLGLPADERGIVYAERLRPDGRNSLRNRTPRRPSRVADGGPGRSGRMADRPAWERP